MNADTTTLNIKRAIYEKGWLAFHLDRPANTCPWSPGSNGHRYWLSGWNCGKAGCQKPGRSIIAKNEGTPFATTQPRCIGCE